MNDKEKSMAWRDVVLNKLDGYCTCFNRGWNRGTASLRRLLPYLFIAFVFLNLWTSGVTPGLHYWVMQQRARADFLNSHDLWAYVYIAVQFFVMPFFFSAWLTYGVFRLVRAMQRQWQKRASS